MIEFGEQGNQFDTIPPAWKPCFMLAFVTRSCGSSNSVWNLETIKGWGLRQIDVSDVWYRLMMGPILICAFSSGKLKFDCSAFQIISTVSSLTPLGCFREFRVQDPRRGVPFTPVVRLLLMLRVLNWYSHVLTCTHHLNQNWTRYSLDPQVLHTSFSCAIRSARHCEETLLVKFVETKASFNKTRGWSLMQLTIIVFPRFLLDSCWIIVFHRWHFSMSCW